jgi:transposase
MKSSRVFIGVDVSKLSLDLYGLDEQRECCIAHQRIENQAKAISRYFKALRKELAMSQILVVFEGTGVYSMTLALTLAEIGVRFAQVSGLEIKLSKGISRGKSDSADAKQIAQFAVTHGFEIKETTLPPMAIIKLATLSMQREKIVKSIKAFKLNKESTTYLPKNIAKELERSNKSILNNLNKNLRLVEDQMMQTICSEEEVLTNYQLLQTIPGIGKQTALRLLVLTHNFTKFKNARKLACYVGVAPFPYQSGTSIKGRTKVHPIADKQMKGLLSLCALTAKKYDNELNAYFLRKVKEGKKKMLVMNTIRNKLITRIFAVIDRQTPYVNLHKYAG